MTFKIPGLNTAVQVQLVQEKQIYTPTRYRDGYGFTPTIETCCHCEDYIKWSWQGQSAQ